MIKKGGDQQFVKVHNQNLILQEIIKQDKISRAELSKKLSISAPSVSNNVEDLIRLGLLNETGPGSSLSGRKPIMLQFNVEYGYIIGIDLSRGQIICALSDLSGSPKAVLKGKKTLNAVGSKLIDMLEEHIHLTVKQGGVSLTDVLVISIASPGIFSNQRHIRLDPDQLNWLDVNPSLVLEDRLKIPVIVENDINAAAVAEYQRLKSYEVCDNMVFISIGRGLGSGLILNGKLYRGSFEGAGEVALMSSSMQNGKLSYYENLLSIDALKERLAKEAFMNVNDDNDALLLDVQKELFHGNKKVVHVMEETASQISLMIANVAALLNPQLIVCGGEMMVLSNYLFPLIKKEIYRIYPFPIELKVSEDMRDIGMQGSLVIGREYAISKLIY